MDSQHLIALGGVGRARPPELGFDTPAPARPPPAAAELERVRAEERERLAREIHDGLGSALMSSLVLVEQGKMDMQAVSKVLRECVDDLKLTIDSMEPIGGDLATLLAMLRFRFGRRIEAAGIAIHWEVGHLPMLAWLDPPAALNVLRILQEAMTNVIKHAHATAITVHAERCGAHLRVSVQDDGRGLGAARIGAGGRGLANMRRRADELGAPLRVEGIDCGTRVSLQLPIDRACAGATYALAEMPAVGSIDAPAPSCRQPRPRANQGWGLRLADAVLRLAP